jgi:hypothetical protein
VNIFLILKYFIQANKCSAFFLLIVIIMPKNKRRYSIKQNYGNKKRDKNNIFRLVLFINALFHFAELSSNTPRSKKKHALNFCYECTNKYFIRSFVALFITNPNYET